MENQVDLARDIQGPGHVIVRELETWPAEQVRYVARRAGGEVVKACDPDAGLEQPLAQMRSEEACPSGDHRAAYGCVHDATFPRAASTRAVVEWRLR